MQDCTCSEIESRKLIKGNGKAVKNIGEFMQNYGYKFRVATAQYWAFMVLKRVQDQVCVHARILNYAGCLLHGLACNVSIHTSVFMRMCAHRCLFMLIATKSTDQAVELCQMTQARRIIGGIRNFDIHQIILTNVSIISPSLRWSAIKRVRQ